VPNYNDQTIAEALAGIQHRRYVLPEIQREFVWGTDRICALFDSLMRDYPISSLLIVERQQGTGERLPLVRLRPQLPRAGRPRLPAARESAARGPGRGARGGRLLLLDRCDSLPRPE
jgi:hypothetical protein